MYAECREDVADGDRALRPKGLRRPGSPKAVESLQRDQDCLLRSFYLPAEHWQHLRTTNAAESTFANFKLRQTAHQVSRPTHQGPADGFQAARHGPETLAASQRSALRRAGQKETTIDKRYSGQERCLIESPIHNRRQYLRSGRPRPGDFDLLFGHAALRRSKRTDETLPAVFGRNCDRDFRSRVSPIAPMMGGTWLRVADGLRGRKSGMEEGREPMPSPLLSFVIPRLRFMRRMRFAPLEAEPQ